MDLVVRCPLFSSCGKGRLLTANGEERCTWRERGNPVASSLQQRLLGHNPGVVVRGLGPVGRGGGRGVGGGGGDYERLFDSGGRAERLPPPVTVGPRSEDTAFFPRPDTG